MAKYKILCDSTCDMKEFELKGTDIEYIRVPLSIQIGEDIFVDDGTKDTSVMQDMLDNYDGKTSSACPSPADWLRVMNGAENLILVTLSHAVSGCYNSALIAKEMFEESNPDVNVRVFDTISGSAKFILIVEEAIRAMKQGLDIDSVCERMEDVRKKTDVIFIVKNVKNLISAGRLHHTIGMVIHKLKLNMISTVNNKGVMEVLHKVRGSENIIRKSYDTIIKRGYSGGRVIICHCLNIEGANLLKDKFLEKFPCADILIIPASAIVGYYAEKNGLVVGYETV